MYVCHALCSLSRELLQVTNVLLYLHTYVRYVYVCNVELRGLWDTQVHMYAGDQSALKTRESRLVTIMTWPLRG